MQIDFNEDFKMFNVDIKDNLPVLEILFLLVSGNQSYMYYLYIIK